MRNSDEVAYNLAISEANLCRGFTKHSFSKTFLKSFVKFTEKDLCQSLFFKIFCNFKSRLWHRYFPLNSEIFKNNFFFKLPPGHCFCSLKSHSGSIQNLPLECWYNNLKTPASFYWNFWWKNFSCWKSIAIKSITFPICSGISGFATGKKSIKQFQHFLSIHEGYTFYTFLQI